MNLPVTQSTYTGVVVTLQDEWTAPSGVVYAQGHVILSGTLVNAGLQIGTQLIPTAVMPAFVEAVDALVAQADAADADGYSIGSVSFPDEAVTDADGAVHAASSYQLQRQGQGLRLAVPGAYNDFAGQPYGLVLAALNEVAFLHDSGLL